MKYAWWCLAEHTSLYNGVSAVLTSRRPHVSYLLCLSKGRTQLTSGCQSVCSPSSHQSAQGTWVCLCKSQPCTTATGYKHTFLCSSDAQMTLIVISLLRCLILAAQFLTDMVSSQLMGSLEQGVGQVVPICSLGGTAEWVSAVQRISWRRLCLVPGVGCSERFLMILVGLMLNPGPCIRCVNCKNATHIKMDFPTALVILRLWCIQDETH